MSLGLAQVGRPQEQTLEVNIMPAPVKGIDNRAAVYGMDPELCIYTYNLIPAEYGLLLRDGYREWVIGIEDTPLTSTGVRTLMAFDGQATGEADDRLFAVTNEGIWDVTIFDSAPILKIAFGDLSGDSGHGVYAHYIDQSGDTFLYYADSQNGLFQYEETTDLWTVPTGITGPTVELIAYVVVHKQRMWFVEQNSTIGWYLPVASNSGQATEFYFGAKFPHGGKLAALINWSVDSGGGLDDYLVSVSTSGDVIPYQGADPSAAETWNSVGTYFIGKLPRGRRISGEYAGNLYILSSFGLISMSDLLRGVDSGSTSQNSLAFKIARSLRVQLAERANDLTWEPKFMPSQGKMVVVSSAESNESPQQWTVNLATESWGSWRGVPMLCLEEWQGKIYFGTLDNTIQVMDVTRDGVMTNPPDPENNGFPIEFSLLTAYSDGGSPGLFKRGQMVRPDFYGSSIPNYNTRILYDYDITEETLGVGSPIPQGDLWDTGLWEAAIWDAGNPVGSHSLAGSGGIGRSLAVAIKGDSSTGQRLISIDVMWQVGGPV